MPLFVMSKINYFDIIEFVLPLIEKRERRIVLDLFIEIPGDVKYIIDTLKEHGYEGYIVGGCVRDSILKRKVNDWDMTTSAKPKEVVKLFDKVILTGIKHGTVTIVLNNNQYEVTTFRNDGEYDDNRHPIKVEFVNNLKEDLSRRDFTINAMAYNDFVGLKDYHEGINDLNKKIIKTVGNPEKRFNEDALRMMRAVRFSAQLNFDIDKDTLQAMEKVCMNIKSISKERIRDEFNKILLSNPQKIMVLKESGLLEYIIPGLNNIEQVIILNTCKVKKSLKLRLSSLLINMDDNIALNILKSLRYDNDIIKKVILLIQYKNADLNNKITLKKTLNSIGIELTTDLVELKKILNDDNSKMNEFEKILNDIHYIVESNECYSLKQLNITGKDLIDAGFEKGKLMGIILNKLLDIVIENPELNHKDILIEKAHNIKGDDKI